MKQISSLLTAVVLLLLCGGCDFRTTREKAEQGDANAQLKLGLMYVKGEGVPQNYEEAAKWTRKAAEQGHAWAQEKLGQMYHYGMGVPTHYGEAAKWTRKAAKQGNAGAQLFLGQMYHYGVGVPSEDKKEAAKWTRKAAEQGHAVAQSNLGQMYHKGEGVPQDYVEAYAWLLLAAENLDSKLFLLTVDDHIDLDPSVFLTAEQIGQVKARAAALRRLIEERKENPKPSVESP